MPRGPLIACGLMRKAGELTEQGVERVMAEKSRGPLLGIWPTSGYRGGGRSCLKGI